MSPHTTRFLSIALLAVFGVSFFFSTAQASFDKAGKYGLEDVAGEAELKGVGTDIPTILGGVVGTALSLITVVFFVLIVYAGIVWMTAHGDDSKSQQARQIIFAAILGMILVLSAYIITNFIFNAVSQNASSGGGSATSTPQGQEKTDKFCTDQGGVCQDNASGDGQDCKIKNDTDGKYKAGLCKLKPSATYLCCLPIQGPEEPPTATKGTHGYDFESTGYTGKICCVGADWLSCEQNITAEIELKCLNDDPNIQKICTDEHLKCFTQNQCSFGSC